MQLKNQRSGSKTICDFSIFVILKGIMTFWSQRVHAFCWTKISTFIKTKGNQKLKILHKVLERQSLCFSSYKNYKLKVKLWWLELVKEKRGHFLYRLFCPKKIFSTLILMYMYWIHFQNINTFTYQKTLLRTLLLLLFKIVESLQCILHEKSLFHSKIFF